MKCMKCFGVFLKNIISVSTILAYFTVTELLLKCYGANASREENTSNSKAVGNGHTKLWIA